MRKIIRKLFFRGAVIREYSPVAIGEDISERVYLEIPARTGMPTRILDVSADHWLLSLEPVTLGVWIQNADDLPAPTMPPDCKIYFTDRAVEPGVRQPEKMTVTQYAEAIARYAVAIADLVFFDKIVEKEGVLFLFKVRSSWLYHIPQIKTLLLFFGFYKKPRLSFRQFKSLVASHSFPRRVRVISFRDGAAFNIFPMDLLGSVPGTHRWVFGLRHSNHSLSRIMATKKIVASEAASGNKDTIYQLGKHHQTGPVAMDFLQFRTLPSELFAFPVPEWVESYHEIALTKTIDLGSHMLLWGECVHEKRVKDRSAHLFHIPFMLWLHQQNRGKEYPLA